LRPLLDGHARQMQPYQKLQPYQKFPTGIAAA
jgi:hypothetical protein